MHSRNQQAYTIIIVEITKFDSYYTNMIVNDSTSSVGNMSARPHISAYFSDTDILYNVHMD